MQNNKRNLLIDSSSCVQHKSVFYFNKLEIAFEAFCSMEHSCLVLKHCLLAMVLTT